MKVSVIIPAYNCEATIARCVDSILFQNSSISSEIIVVDDGSTDRTAGIVQEMSLKHDSIILHTKKNGGVSSARNCGIQMALGEYIMFVDSDDEIKPSLLNCLIEHIAHADLVVGGIELHQDQCVNSVAIKGCYSVPETMERYGGTIPGLLLNGPCCKLYRKSLVDKHGVQFDPDRSLGEDTLFVFQYLSKCKTVCFVDYDGYIYYQQGTTSLMKKYRQEAFFEAKDVYMHLMEIVEETAGATAAENMMQVYSNVLMGYLRNTIANRHRTTKNMVEATMHEYLNDPIVQKAARNDNTKAMLRKITNVLTRHKCYYLLRFILTMHVSRRGV